MAADLLTRGEDFGVDPRAVRRKASWRILPLIFVCYIVAYLDRVNAGSAKLRMQGLPGFTPEVFGWGFGIFFAGYLLLEIPGALLVEHWSARKWFARILVTWGVCSMATALVRTPWEFYLARFLLGVAEAGFFPGVIVYFTHWFPRADRARALAGLVFGVPVSLALGSLASGALLEVDWFGVAGWQWLFLVEGFPAVLLGVAVLFLLTDRPAQAKWLSPAEAAWLTWTLEAERREAAAAGGGRLREALARPTVWLLALGILAANTGGYALTFWLPTVFKNLLAHLFGGPQLSDQVVLGWLSLVYACGVAGVWLSGQSSDRTGERKWHCVVGLVLTGLCLAASVVPGQPWAVVVGWLCLFGFFAFFWPSPFWALPTLALSDSAAAVAIGAINICANVAGLIGNPAVGALQSAGYDDRVCLLCLAACYVVGGAVVALVRVPRMRRAAGPPPGEPGPAPAEPLPAALPPKGARGEGIMPDPRRVVSGPPASLPPEAGRAEGAL
jgi:ACS family tartrate transporter-like MFS transporter